MLKYVRKCNVKIAISHYSMIIGRHRYTKAICTRNFLRCICLYAGIEELNLVGKLGDYESEQTVEYGISPSAANFRTYTNSFILISSLTGRSAVSRPFAVRSELARDYSFIRGPK